MPTNLFNEQAENNIQEVANTESRILGTSDIPNDFTIEEAVITILDKGGEQPVLNEFPLDLTEAVHNFLYKHIEKCLKNDRLKFGIFNPQVNSVKDNAVKLLRNELSIVDSSKALSSMLFGIIQNNDGIESCDLVTATIATNNGPIVAILKLDYAKNFIHHVDVLDEKISIGITPVKTGLPCNNIQKAAFIKPNSNDGFELYYLDEYKKNKDSEDFNIQYWSNNFLCCSEVTNSKATTLDFIKASEEWLRAKRLDSVKESEAVRTLIRESLLENDNISISSLADEMFDSPENVASYKEYMTSLRLDDEIIIDKPAAIKKLSKIKIKIDKDITLNIDREVYNDGSKFQITENPDGSINMILKNITSYVEK